MKHRNILALIIAFLVSITVLGCAKKVSNQTPPESNQQAQKSSASASTVGKSVPTSSAAPAASKPKQQLSAKDILKKTQGIYKSFRTLSIDGAAKVTKSIAGKSKSTSGSISIRFARPNKIRLKSGSGKEASISVCDGKNLWLYRADINRYIKIPAPSNLSKALGGSLTVKLLEGVDISSRAPDAKLLGTEIVSGSRCFVIEGSIEEPLAKGGSAVTKLWIDSISYLIRRARVVHRIPPEAFPEGQTRPKSALVVTQEVTFKKIVPNEPVSSRIFRFAPPPGAKEAKEADGAEQDPLLGAPAQFFTMPSLDGKEVSLYSMKGRPILLVFWSTLSPISKKHLPVVEDVYQDMKRSGLEVVAVTLDGNKDAAEQFVKENHITFPILFDYDKAMRVANSYSKGQMGLPTIYIIDKKGFIAGKIVGPGTAEQIKNDLAKLGIK